MVSFLPAPASSIERYVGRNPAIGAAVADVNVSGGQTFFVSAFQAALATVTETQVQFTMPAAATIMGLSTRVETNTLGVIGRVKVRKNGVDTASDIQIGAGLTGNFSSATQVALVAGDEVSISIGAPADAGAMAVSAWGLSLQWS